MALSKKKGRGSILRFMVMTDLSTDASGNYKKPLNFSTVALTLPEVTTSDISMSHAEVTDDAVEMYGSAGAGSGELWKDSDPGEGNWSVPFSGVWQPTPADRANQEALRSAQIGRKIIWIERQIVGDTVWEGGAAWISTGAFPIPADGNVTWSFTATGKGKFWEDTATATSATA